MSTKPPIMGFTMRPLYTVGTPLSSMGLRGERKISSFFNDTFHSLDGAFAIVSRDVWKESGLSMRLYPPKPIKGEKFVELWAHGVLVGRTSCLTVALNWIILKVQHASHHNPD